MLIASKTDGEVGVLRAQDGSLVWRRTLEAPLAIPPSTADDLLFVGIKGGKVLALNRDTGDPLWTFAVGEDATGLLALKEQLVVGTRANYVYSLNPANGRVRWDWRVGGDVSGPPAADEKNIYFAARDNLLRAVDRKNGNLRWKQALPSRPAGGPLRTADVVLMPTVAADIAAFWADTGKIAFTIKAAGELGGVPYLREHFRPTAPRVFALSRDGTLQGFASRFEAPPTPATEAPGGSKVGW
jgi:outer membrane protein assembly factor BamB